MPFLLPLVHSRFATAEQLAALAGRPASSARNHLGKLFHLRLVERVTEAVPIAYALHADGAKWLYAQGLVAGVPAVPEVTRKSRGRMPHELAVTDARVWAVRCAKAAGAPSIRWREGPANHPAHATPDATVSFPVGGRTFAAYVEVDLESEDERHWLRHYSLSDRIRYYWTSEHAQSAVARLYGALAGKSVPRPLFWQHMPAAEQFSDAPLDPEALLVWRVTKSLAEYHAACCGAR